MSVKPANIRTDVGRDGDYIGDELSLFAHATNWKKYWSAKLEPHLASAVLEVGAGIGTNLCLLRQRELKWTALEPDTKQAEAITELVSNQELSNVEVIAGTLSDIPQDKKFQTIIYIDVLEHIEDDQYEVDQAIKHLDTGGKLIVLSPAHQRLFSPFDKAVGHFRRYDKKSLRALTPESASIESLFYLDSIGCFASLANALILEASMPTDKQIWFWDKILVPISRITDKLLAHTVGKTVVIIWQKI